jgi:hypothetical protein
MSPVVHEGPGRAARRPCALRVCARERKLARIVTGAVVAALVGVLSVLPLALAPGSALAQSDKRPVPSTQKSDEEVGAIRERVAQWLATCLDDWDQATHMSKKEWKTTCERVAAERGKFLLENPGMDSLAKSRRR